MTVCTYKICRHIDLDTIAGLTRFNVFIIGVAVGVDLGSIIAEAIVIVGNDRDDLDNLIGDRVCLLYESALISRIRDEFGREVYFISALTE